MKKDGHVIVLEDGNARKDVVESIENSEFNTAGEYAIPVGNIFGHGSKTSIVAIVLEKT